MEKLPQSMIRAKGSDPLAETKIRYGYALLKNEVFKLLFLFGFYLCVGKLAPFLTLLLVLLPIRLYSGGLHMKSNLSCFVFSFAFTFLAICILPQIRLPGFAYPVLCVVSFLLILLLSPFSSPKKPITSEKRVRFFRRMSVLFTALAVLSAAVLWYCDYILLSLTGQWTIFLQAVQLLLAHIFKKGTKLC